MPHASPNRPKPTQALAPVAGVLLGLLAATAPARAVQRADGAEPAGTAFRIVALGSSSTQGIGATSPAMSYPAQLGRLFEAAFHGRPPVAVANRGIAGEDIDEMASRVGTDVLSVHPDLVIWQAGSNDPLRGVPVDRFEAKLRKGIEAIRATGTEVVLIEPQWSPVIERADAKGRFVEAVREVGAAERVDVVRRFDLMQRWVEDGLVTASDLVGPDNLHMTDRGYGLLAKAVLDEISAGSSAFRARVGIVASQRP